MRGEDFHYHYLLRPPLVAIVVNLVVSLTAGLLASPKSERARGEAEEREKETAADWRRFGGLEGIQIVVASSSLWPL